MRELPPTRDERADWTRPVRAHRLSTALIALLVATLILAAIAWLPEAGLSSPPVDLAQARADPLDGDYAGQAALSWVLSGTYADPLPTPGPGSPDQGRIDLPVDLALHLEQSGNAVSGYVDLAGSLVFPQAGEVQATPVGPRVSGTFDGQTLRLESEQFSILLAEESNVGGRVIPEQRVNRQFRLVSTAVDQGGAIITGEYRETLWGYGLTPFTSLGTFELRRPSFDDAGGPAATPTPTRQATATPTRLPGATTTIYLPIIVR